MIREAISHLENAKEKDNEEFAELYDHEPGDRVHRAVNIAGDEEEITIFFLSHPNDHPQPDAN